jgi:cyclohexyl-isocyanide hydratase
LDKATSRRRPLYFLRLYGRIDLRSRWTNQRRRATTHWSAFDLLPLFGAIPVNERVVVDDNWVFAAGVTAGIDGALRIAADLRGEKVAQLIQLGIAYAPEPPFQSGTPESAPPDVLAEAKNGGQALATRRLETARRVAARLGINA